MNLRRSICFSALALALLLPPASTTSSSPQSKSKRQLDACAGIVTTVAGVKKCLEAGDTFRDCVDCPEMVVIPEGDFVMGSPDTEPGRFFDESPQRRIEIPAPFAIGKYEVTNGEFTMFLNADPRHHPKDTTWFETKSADPLSRILRSGERYVVEGGYEDHPVIGVSWHGARAYARRLNQQTSHSEKPRYRLPSEAEWEYVARGGSTAPNNGTLSYWCGAKACYEYANYGKDECCDGMIRGTDKWEYTAPKGSFLASPFGVFDMHGNVLEWMEDCYQPYDGAIADPSPKTVGDCLFRVLRGGSWKSYPPYLRSAYRNRYYPEHRLNEIGFRLFGTISS